MVGARDQERFICETSAVVVVGNIAGLMGVREDDEKCGLKGPGPPLGLPGLCSCNGWVPVWSHVCVEAALVPGIQHQIDFKTKIML